MSAAEKLKYSEEVLVADQNPTEKPKIKPEQLVEQASASTKEVVNVSRQSKIPQTSSVESNLPNVNSMVAPPEISYRGLGFGTQNIIIPNPLRPKLPTVENDKANDFIQDMKKFREVEQSRGASKNIGFRRPIGQGTQTQILRNLPTFIIPKRLPPPPFGPNPPG